MKGGDFSWPPVGTFHGHQWGPQLATSGYFLMATDIKRLRGKPWKAWEWLTDVHASGYPSSSPTGSWHAPPTIDLWEPYDWRPSRTFLREREGEVPPCHLPVGGRLEVDLRCGDRWSRAGSWEATTVAWSRPEPQQWSAELDTPTSLNPSALFPHISRAKYAPPPLRGSNRLKHPADQEVAVACP